MARRSQSQLTPPAPKKFRSSDGSSQPSLFHFFSPTSGECSMSTRPVFVDQSSPEYLGIHIYSAKEISESSGLDRDYKEYWNEHVVNLCKDPTVRKKLKDKAILLGSFTRAICYDCKLRK